MPLRPFFPLLVVISAALVVGCGSNGSEAGMGRIVVEKVAVDRPATKDQAALRFVVDNGTDVGDTLIAVRTEVAGSASLHRSEIVDGISKMDELAEVEIPAGSDVTFASGGLHVMLEDLRRPLDVGDEFEVTFEFARAGTVTATAEVVVPGATTDDEEHAHG